MERLIILLREEASEYALEILECMELLEQAVGQCASPIAQSIYRAFNQRDYERAESLKDLHETIDRVQRKLKYYSGLLESGSAPEELATMSNGNESAGILPSYNELQLDPNIPHTLNESYTHRRPAGFELFGTKYDATEWKGVLTKTCELLASKDASLFRSFLWDKSMQGRKLRYFSQDPREIRAPRRVEGTDIYVTTHLSANDIGKLIVRMLTKYDIDVTEYKVFLRADYSLRHA